VAREGQLAREGVGDEERPQETLRVLVHLADPAAVSVHEQALQLQGLPLALQLVDGARLLAALVDGEHDTAIEKLLVHLDRRRREHDHHRAFHVVLVRH